jgi:hypothetical protein
MSAGEGPPLVSACSPPPATAIQNAMVGCLRRKRDRHHHDHQERNLPQRPGLDRLLQPEQHQDKRQRAVYQQLVTAQPGVHGGHPSSVFAPPRPCRPAYRLIRTRPESDHQPGDAHRRPAAADASLIFLA